MHLADAAAPDGIRTVPVPPERTAAPALADAQVREVARLARQAEAHFGRPQDIEWTLRGTELFLLQSRPITALAERPDPDARSALWENANIIESYSGITTPLTFSFARRAYENVYREFCRLLRVPRRCSGLRAAVFALEQRIVLQQALDFLVEFECRQLQQPDRLLQLRRQGEVLAELELKTVFHES